jgi:hypothetical protein
MSYKFFFRKRCVPRYAGVCVCVCVCGVCVLCTCNLHFLDVPPSSIVYAQFVLTSFGTTSLAAGGATYGVEV